MTKTDLAIAALRDAIAQGRIKRGEHLTVTRIARLLGMSPTPIREAFRILQAEGLISHTPHHGMVVADLTVEQALEIYPLRAMLERMAVTLTVSHLTAKDRQRLVTLEKTMVEAQAIGDHKLLSQANTDWHLTFANRSNNRYLKEFILRLWRMYPQDAIWSTLGRTERSMQEHRAVMQAVLSGDAEGAGKAMEAHMLSVQNDIVAHLQKGLNNATTQNS